MLYLSVEGRVTYILLQFPHLSKKNRFNSQVYYYIVDSPRNEGKDFFEINKETGEVFTKIVFDREKQGAYALEVEARDGFPSARPNSDNQPNSGESFFVGFCKFPSAGRANRSLPNNRCFVMALA